MRRVTPTLLLVLVLSIGLPSILSLAQSTMNLSMTATPGNVVIGGSSRLAGKATGEGTTTPVPDGTPIELQQRAVVDTLAPFSPLDSTVTTAGTGTFALTVPVRQNTLFKAVSGEDSVTVRVNAHPSVTISAPAKAVNTRYFYVTGTLASDVSGYAVKVLLYQAGVLRGSTAGTVQIDGSYSIRTRVGRVGMWVLRTSFPATSDDRFEAGISARRYLTSYKITPYVTCAISPRLLRVGGTVRIYGSVSPNFSGRPIRIQRYVRRRWYTLKTLYLNSSSRYSWTYRPPAGYHILRAYFPEQGDHWARGSATRATRVYVPLLSAITASASPRYPDQYSYVTIYVRAKDQYGRALGRVYVKTTWHYKTTTSYETGYTGSNGLASLTRYISRATKGYKVVVDAVASKGGRTRTASTYFIPQ